MLDLSAAFDTVDHNLLLEILKHEIGLEGRVLAWFKSFLIGRSQRIRIGGTTSEEIIIMFGVPQGSVLGPVLFNIYIRSIYLCVQRLGFKIHGYADDHQILKSFRYSSQSIVLTYDLQRCFATIKSWMAQYFLQLNDPKTQICIFGSRRILNKIKIRGVNFPSGTTIRFIPNVKSLGVYMDSLQNLRNQVLELKKKAFCIIRKINKVRFFLSDEQRKVIVNSFVISCLDY